jgi:hypothetical protein
MRSYGSSPKRVGRIMNVKHDDLSLRLIEG